LCGEDGTKGGRIDDTLSYSFRARDLVERREQRFGKMKAVLGSLIFGIKKKFTIIH